MYDAKEMMYDAKEMMYDAILDMIAVEATANGTYFYKYHGI